MLAKRFFVAGIFAIYPFVWLVSACQTPEKKDAAPVVVPAPPPPVAIKTDTVLLCRDTSEVNKGLIAALVKNGWQFAGQLHNDGINCTMTLWLCYNAKAACALDLDKK